ncbi:MAG TPA: NUDIX domain-containing protein [Polyangia bacterium]|nr:NUDIX domain-containing protein [Polyangia bacterium]
MRTGMWDRIRSWWRPLSRGRARWTSSGGVVFNRRGEVALVKQHGRRAGLRWTFPKGKVDAGESVQEAAVREVREESGLRARITAYLGAYEGERAIVHYFVMVLEGDDRVHDGETVEVCFAAPGRARKLLRSRRDRAVLKRALDHQLGLTD